MVSTIFPYIFFGLLGAFLTYIGILSHRDTARKRAASDLLHSILQDKRLGEASLTAALVHRAENIDLEDFAETETDKTRTWLGSDNRPLKHKEDARYADVVDDIQHLLCYYEFVASGIKRRVYDEEVVRDCLHSTVVGYADNFDKFIKKRANFAKKDSLWHELITLANRWRALGPPVKPEDDDFVYMGLLEGKLHDIGIKIMEFRKKRKKKLRINKSKKKADNPKV